MSPGERARSASRRAVSTIRSFSLVSLRDLIVAAGPTVVLVALACFIAYLVVDPAPPRIVRLASGQENSAYEAFGARYAKELKSDEIKVVLQPSLGSQENLLRLQRGEADIAFVQSGSTSEEQAGQLGLVSLGSLFTEPVWLFLRSEVKATSLTGLRGKRINLGPEGTGVPTLFRQVLAVNGVEPNELTIGALENTPATVELLAGRIDGLVFSSAPEAPLIQMLLQTPGIRLFNFSQAEAYTRRLPFLTHVTLPRGIVDLGRDIPSQDYHLIAPTATLVAREDLHPALVDLFVKAAGEIHGGAGWFQQQGQFPSPKFTEIPVSEEAAKYYRDGPPLLQRYMRFWLANLFERLWVVVVALAALVIPLSKIVPPLYVWRVRSRVYRWYGELRAVEQAWEAVQPEAEEARREIVREDLLHRLDDIEERVNHISIPLAYADGLYGLRGHINIVRQRLRASAPAAAGPGDFGG
ncbi:ABC transporter substrate-binding protein [Massilia sp. Dwa41.01b]|uniref:TAXI family TRAP transporter solute-binding subunit n=1 Tax=unclassified Massilia TaxID=2609279 RepID=UPI00160142B4|nr:MULTISPECIES: TAXI family TRAP transporter solute-binding subunit [unclassified Massilia]QNA88155.1 ABC transporter substrate-binding protein [Massilia sp. Dwa41.01b]QNA99061.1 ABC transporter substrate-binding protein [Massilia sp. Se16.2.3]